LPPELAPPVDVGDVVPDVPFPVPVVLWVVFVVLVVSGAGSVDATVADGIGSGGSTAAVGAEPGMGIVVPESVSVGFDRKSSTAPTIPTTPTTAAMAMMGPEPFLAADAGGGAGKTWPLPVCGCA
jgi:hypothetical protein